MLSSLNNCCALRGLRVLQPHPQVDQLHDASFHLKHILQLIALTEHYQERHWHHNKLAEFCLCDEQIPVRFSE